VKAERFAALLGKLADEGKLPRSRGTSIILPASVQREIEAGEEKASGGAPGTPPQPREECAGHEPIELKTVRGARGLSPWRGRLAIAFLVFYMVAALFIEGHGCRGIR
jgi:hypothetical protein